MTNGDLYAAAFLITCMAVLLWWFRAELNTHPDAHRCGPTYRVFGQFLHAQCGCGIDLYAANENDLHVAWVNHLRAVATADDRAAA